MNAEMWASVRGYEGLYEVSNSGQVRSLDRVTARRDGSAQRTNARVLKQFAGARMGYLYVCLSKDGRSQMQLVHRLVAIAFLPVDQDRRHVGHIDHNNKNNQVSNLHWVTPQENTAESIESGRWKNLHRNGKVLAANNPARARKLTLDAVDRIRSECRDGVKQSDIAARYGITQSTVSKINIGRVWSSKVRSTVMETAPA